MITIYYYLLTAIYPCFYADPLINQYRSPKPFCDIIFSGLILQVVLNLLYMARFSVWAYWTMIPMAASAQHTYERCHACLMKITL